MVACSAGCGAQAAVFCDADNAYLCASCDHAAHAGPLTKEHKR